MSRVLTLTDDLIREALAPSSGIATPDGLLDGIAIGIRRTAQHRSVADRLGVAAPTLHLELADHRLGWLLAAALLAAVVLGAAAAGAWLLRDTSVIGLAPSGVDVLSVHPGYSTVMTDGRGVGWAIGQGHVTRLDSARGDHATWTIADDAAFGWHLYAGTTAAAAAGGIWMTRGSGLVRFDGAVFRDGTLLPIPDAEPTAMDESPEGSLWAAFAEGVFRWDGTSWASFPGADDCFALIGAGPDEAWATCRPSAPRVLHLTNGSWEGFDSFDDHAAGRLGAAAMAEGPDGSIWVAQSQYGVARWTGGRFVDLGGPEFSPYDLVVTDQGDAWVLGEGRMARLLAGSWEEVEPPGPAGAEWLTGIAVVGSDLVITTDQGLYRGGPDGWEPMVREPTPLPDIQGFGRLLIAVSADEAWAADDLGVWHYTDGSWTGPDRPPDLEADARIRELAVSPDGDDLAIATDQGVAVRGVDGWSWGWTGVADSVDYAPDGSIWAAVRTSRLVHLTEVQGRLEGLSIRCPAGGWFVAAAADGSAYTGDIQFRGTGGLARSDGGTCTTVSGYGRTDVVALEADPTGGVVAVILEGANPPYTRSIVRIDGEIASTLRPGEPVDAGNGASVEVDGTGRVWLADVFHDQVIQRYDAGAWRVVTDLDTGTQLSVAPDGTLWLVGGSGIERIDADKLR
jgi:hypothetical protein